MTRATIRERLDAAAPGPWEVGKDGRCVYFAPVWEEWGEDGERYISDHHGLIYAEGGHTADDAAFIAHAPTDIAALLAVADAAWRMVHPAEPTGPQSYNAVWRQREASWDDLRRALAALEAAP